MNPTRQGIYNALKNAGGVTALVGQRIYHSYAPDAAAYPFIIFEKVSGVQTRAFGDEAFKREVWMVKAVDHSKTSNAAETVASAIDAVLNEGSITVSGKTLCDLIRVGDIDYTENDGDQQYRHHGANYAAITT